LSNQIGVDAANHHDRFLAVTYLHPVSSHFIFAASFIHGMSDNSAAAVGNS
jgi:hypothetical protein